MAQVLDYIVSNQTFPNTRADINNIFEAIGTNNSGTTAPSNQLAGQFWIDTTSTTWTLYIHDGTDDIQFATIDTSANTVNFTDSSLSIQSDPNPTLGANLDLNSNDITGTGNINITGNITASGNLAGTITTASQPNITSVGTLTSFTSTGIDDNATSTAITIDSSENVGIGASNNTSYDANAQNFLLASSGNTGMTIRSAGATPFAMIHFADGTTDNDEKRAGRIVYQHSNDTLALHTANSEAMRIDSSGNLMVGKTSTSLIAGFSVLGGANAGTLQVRRDIAAANSSSVCFISRGTSDGNILEFYKDTTAVGNISTRNGSLYIGEGDTALKFLSASDNIVASTAVDGSGRDNAIDLGASGTRFKDLYLSGSAYLGGTTSANALDDYEEGSWTPSVSSGFTLDSTQTAVYRKIGDVVHVFGSITVDVTSGTEAVLAGLPFNCGVANEPFIATFNDGSTFEYIPRARTASSLPQLKFNPQVTASNVQIMIQATYRAS